MTALAAPEVVFGEHECAGPVTASSSYGSPEHHGPRHRDRNQGGIALFKALDARTH